MKDNTSINISDPKAAVAFLDACFPKKVYSEKEKQEAQEKYDLLVDEPIRKSWWAVVEQRARLNHLLDIINS